MSWDGTRLCLAAGGDLTYHHLLEVVFTGVSYLACPTAFTAPRFRPATPDEVDLARRHVGEDSTLVVAFDVEARLGEGWLPCLVAADTVEVVEGLVYRYWRDDLGAGERMASFVRPPGEGGGGIASRSR